MDPSPLAKKLRVQAGNRLLVLDPPDDYLLALAPLPDRVEVVTAAPPANAGGFDVVQAFARDRAALASIAPVAIAATKPGGVLWFCYPKRTGPIATDFHRDAGWEPVTEAGWDGVAQVSIDGTWSALRFRPVADIKRTRRSAT